MARTTNNPLLAGVSGPIGNLLIRQTKEGTIISRMPVRVNTPPTPKQASHRKLFAAAVKHAKAVQIKYLRKHGMAAKTESALVYQNAIKEFIAAGKKAKSTRDIFVSKEEKMTRRKIPKAEWKRIKKTTKR